MTLIEFKDRFLSMPLSSLRVVEARNSGNRMSLIMLREPPFQAELVIWNPGVVIPAHRHPHIDSLGIHVSGDLVFIKGNCETETNVWINRSKIWPEKFVHGLTFNALSTEWHGGKAGKTGCTFWSIQKWTDGSDMTASGIDWEGPALPVAKLCVCS